MKKIKSNRKETYKILFNEQKPSESFSRQEKNGVIQKSEGDVYNTNRFSAHVPKHHRFRQERENSVHQLLL